MMVVSKNQPNFQWITKQTSRVSDDVSISVTKNGANKPRMQIVFRNKKGEHFKSGYVMLGIDGDRLYFCETDARTGYTLTKGNSNHNRYLQCSAPTAFDWARMHIGDYRLDQDAKSGLYYIDARRRNE